MTPHHIALVRESAAQLVPHADRVAALFYDTLFTADPALRPLFRGDMVEQGRRLMTMLVTAVRLLDDPDSLRPTLRILGARHAGYGVRPGHYDTVEQALLGTLSLGLGEGFTPPVREAWCAVYASLAATMQEAAVPGAVVTD